MQSAYFHTLTPAHAKLPRHHVGEWTFESEGTFGSEAATALEVDVQLTSPSGKRYLQPAFWAGGSRWKVRWSSGEVGLWRFQVVTPGFEFSGAVEVIHCDEASNRLFRHGPVRVSDDRTHFIHEDGTPFFYLADTWWLGMSGRLPFPDGFAELADYRARQGFSVARLDAGLNTDCGHFDPRSANEGGQPWDEDYRAIRPEFFDAGDKRIAGLAERGICPAIIGAWGHFLMAMGVGKMKQHLRYCVARWNAFPVFWYMTIEYDMPFYGDDGEYDEQKNVEDWMEVGRYFRSTDAMRRPVSLQSWTTRASSRLNLPEPDLIDFDSLQLGSCDSITINEMVEVLPAALKIQPRIPVLAADQCYEGLNEANWANIQVNAFWAAVLLGSSGYTYGANGIWQFNDKPHDFGPAPSGIAWGGPGWSEAMVFPGAEQIGHSKQLLERYDFHRIEPHPEWFVDQGYGPPAFSGGIPGGARFFYLTFGRHRADLCELEPGAVYQAYWYDPVRFGEYEIEPIQADENGKATCPVPPVRQPHILVLEPAAGGA